MSETNLLRAKYALDLRNVRLSIDRKEQIDLTNFHYNSKGLVDITEHSKLNEFSALLQESKSDEQKRYFSSGNLNLYALNDRVRLRVLEIFSDLLHLNLFEVIQEKWMEQDEEGTEIAGSLFSAIFFEKDESPKVAELLRFWFTYTNPAHNVYSNEFFGQDKDLDHLEEQITSLMEIIEEELPKIEEGSIIQFLRLPEENHPTSIKAQINYIINNWSKYLSQENMKFLLLAMDLIKEEEKFRGFGGPGPAEVYEFGAGASFTSGAKSDFERFSKDKDWMPSLVLLAKNIHVWLDQLSQKYGREIRTLNAIPDEELDILANRGITGLWLVGVWERSPASKKIKNLTGNEAAISSAYSIYDYAIAMDLGGKDAYDTLKKRLLQRGIRIGADMVPNHMGIFSKWVVEHPDWFIQTREKPFPSYEYTGINLSEDPSIEIYLEDHYYDQSDAAVTFKRVDKENNDVRYIYHGNDGTSFPWNDTAQLDFLNEEAREHVISKIVDVAQQFPIIRFDAAMVLAKQHIRRLWYPAPGEGGDIPSRSQFSMAEEEFHEKIPNEFWREVVDRINTDAPDTLLLAEAFWLLEGYFVRTLGMHRVYNSAFMKMLKDEENAKYRQTVKNVLEYDPEILKRFVNYLTTPDEDPAISQFGTGDKYFGLAIMMATMPGLPMFGHGQFEGFTEKYGMEYNKAHYNEAVDRELLNRHEEDIVPLLKKRYLFAGSQNFYLYDFFTADGTVNEDVFAYSNQYESEKALVIYNNKYAHASGWVKRSVAYAEKLDDKTTRLRQVDLFEGLDLANGDGYLLFRDHVTGLEYIRSKDEIREKGLYVDVGAFKYHVFIDLKEVYDNQGIWSQIAAELDGEGTNNIQVMYDQLHSPTLSQSEDTVQKEEDEQEETLTSVKVRLNEAEDENVALKGQIAAMNAQLEEVDDLNQRIETLQEENVKLKEQLQEIPNQQDIASLTDKITNLEDELESREKEMTSLELRNSELQDKIEKLLSQQSGSTDKAVKEKEALTGRIESLEDDNDLLESKVEELKAKNEKLDSQLNLLQAELEDTSNLNEEQAKELKRKGQEIVELKGEKKELAKQIEEKKGYQSRQDTLLSSVLLETIKNRLEASSTGIKLRNLAMSLGISVSVCMDHVRTMQEKNQVEIRYSSDDDSNPIISAVERESTK